MGIEDPNTAINGPLKWRFAGGPMMDQHGMQAGIFVILRSSIAKKPYVFVIFQGGGSRSSDPSGSAHVVCAFVVRMRQNQVSFRRGPHFYGYATVLRPIFGILVSS